MSSDWLERSSRWAGTAAVVVWVAAMAILGNDHIGIPGGIPEEGADETLAFFRDNADRVTAGSWLFMIGSLLFIWFAGALRRRLSAAEEGRDVFAPLAFAAGVATGILTLGMAAGGLAAALSVDEITASTAEALNGVELVFFVSAELAAVVLLTASAAAAWRTRPFPRWWAIASLVIAVWLLIAPIGWIALLVGVPVWTVVTSVLLDRGAAPVR